MISFFNKIGNTWIAKLILIALGVSMMAFWGIGGISNTSGSDTTAMQVGRRKISMDELNRAFETERAQISRLTGQYVSPKQAIEMGLLQKAVQKKLSDTVSSVIQDDLGLAASDEAVRAYVERHPVFQDSLGNFDRNLFMAYLSQMKLTEGQLAEQLRDELANQHLSNTIHFAAPTSKALAEMMWYYQNQERDVEALLIETDKIAVTTHPTTEDLKEYYEAYSSEFMVPETRDIELLFLTPSTIGQNIQIPQSALQEAYEAQKANFEIPERRRVYQIRLSTKESAETARSGLNAANFMDKATELGQTQDTTDFGAVTRNDLLPELANAVFSAQKNTVIGPVETEMGWHLLVVTEIQPGVQQNKDRVYAEIRAKMVADLAYDKMNDTARALEDLLGEGLSLSDAANRLGLQTQSFKNVEIAGTTLPETVRNQELMQDLFTLKEGESSALTEQANGYLVAQVRKITPVQVKNFLDVQADLKKLWFSEQQKAALPNLIQKATEQVKAGSIPVKLGQLIVAKHVSLKESKDLPGESLNTIFTQGLGYENAEATPLKNGAIITVVKKTHTPLMKADLLPEQMEKLSADNSQLLYNGVIETYMNKLDIKVNTEHIQKAFAKYQTE